MHWQIYQNQMGEVKIIGGSIFLEKKLYRNDPWHHNKSLEKNLIFMYARFRGLYDFQRDQQVNFNLK